MEIVKPAGKSGNTIPVAPPPIVNRIGSIGPFKHTACVSDDGGLKKLRITAGLMSKRIEALEAGPQLP